MCLYHPCRHSGLFHTRLSQVREHKEHSSKRRHHATLYIINININIIIIIIITSELKYCVTELSFIASVCMCVCTCVYVCACEEC